MLLGFSGFDWDQGNILKNLKKHKVLCSEAEEAFFNENLIYVIFNRQVYYVRFF